MNTTNIKYDLEFPVKENQVYRIFNIFKKNNNEKSIKNLEWQYLLPPGGGSCTAISVDSDGVDAAVYSVFKVLVKVNEDIKIACQSLDTLTDINHRGRGQFNNLANAIFKKLKNDEVLFVYGFPNSNSAHGFFNKLGWSKIGYPPFRLYLNNVLFPLSYVFKQRLFARNYPCLLFLMYKSWCLRKKNNFQVKKNIEFNSIEYDKLWKKFSAELPVTIWRNGEYMCWRYQKKPNRFYHYLSVYSGEKLAGVIVFTMLEKHGGKIGYVMDLIYNPSNYAAGLFLLIEALKKMNTENVDAVLAWADMSFSVNKPYFTSCFFKLSRRLQPIKLYFGYKFLDLMDKNSFGKSDFYVSYADSDTV